MVDYYSKRKEAMDYIEGILKNNPVTDKTTIYYNISKHFGFGRGFVDRHLKLLEEMEIISMDAVSVKWLKITFKSEKEFKDEAEVDVFLKEQQITPASRDELQ